MKSFQVGHRFLNSGIHLPGLERFFFYANKLKRFVPAISLIFILRSLGGCYLLPSRCQALNSLGKPVNLHFFTFHLPLIHFTIHFSTTTLRFLHFSLFTFSLFTIVYPPWHWK